MREIHVPHDGSTFRRDGRGGWTDESPIPYPHTKHLSEIYAPMSYPVFIDEEEKPERKKHKKPQHKRRKRKQ